MTVIQVKNACKSFKNHKVLDHISITCEQGECVGIVGRNGCGKTVLFKCICGLYCLDEGEIYVDGRKKNDEEILQDIGIIIENPAFLERYSGKKNLELLYEIRNKKNTAYIEEVIKKVGLDPELKDHVKKYSMGMKQRLAIAQAIMENPHILIFDEPMNGLDAQGVEDIRKLLLDLKKQGVTMLLASHNKEDIQILCDKVYEMDAGAISEIELRSQY